MHEVDVDRMMARISARQYKEWEAYEMATGPIDSSYEREMLAEQNELTQVNNLLTGASLMKKGKKNPAGKFRAVTRPDEIWQSDGYYGEEDPELSDDLEDYYQDVDEIEDDEEEPEEELEPGAYDPAKDPFAHWDS
jgi:hypothetical protein